MRRGKNSHEMGVVRSTSFDSLPLKNGRFDSRWILLKWGARLKKPEGDRKLQPKENLSIRGRGWSSRQRMTQRINIMLSRNERFVRK